MPVLSAIVILLGLDFLMGSGAFASLVLLEPSAHVAAFMAEAPVMSSADGTLYFITQGLQVRVTESCSGSGFFTVLCASSVYLLLLRRCGKKVWLLTWLSMLPVAIIANAIRILLSVYTQKLALMSFPASYGAIVHQTTGIFVFLTALIVFAFVFHYLTKTYSDGHSPH